MPTVKRLGAKRPHKAQGEGVVARIIPVSQVSDGIKMLLYGQSKAGKTRLACTFPKPLLLIGVAGYGTEKGTRSVSTIKGVSFIALENSEELEVLVNEDQYNTFVLDTAGGLQERVVNEFTGHDPTVRRDWRHVSKGDWGPINSRTMQRLRCVLDAAELRGKSVVIIAHERTFDADNEGSELITPHVGAALTPGVCGWLDGVVDYIGQCFIREQVVTKKLSVGGRKINRDAKTGRMEYCLRVGPHPVYKTGFRVPIGTQLPDVLVDPDFDKLYRLIQGKEV